MNVELTPSSDARTLIVFHKQFALVYPFLLCLWSFNKFVVQAMHRSRYNFVKIFCCQ